MRSDSHNSKSVDSTAPTMAAAQHINTDARVAAMLAPQISSPHPSASMAIGIAEERCQVSGNTADRSALRTLGTSDSMCVAPLATR